MNYTVKFTSERGGGGGGDSGSSDVCKFPFGLPEYMLKLFGFSDS